MTFTVISALPTPPQSTDTQAVFEARADAEIAALNPFITQTNTLASEINTFSTTLGLSLIGNSTTTNTINLGAISFVVQPNLGYAVGMTLKIAATASPSNNMYGTVSSYNIATGSIVLNIDGIGATSSGTYSAWTFSLSPPAISGFPGIEYVVATGTSSAYVIAPTVVISIYKKGQMWEIEWPTTCVDSPTAAVSGLAAKNIVILASDGTFANATARDIVTGSVSTLETVDVGSGILALWLKNPSIDHSNLTLVSANTAFTIATSLGKVIKSTGSAARQHTLPVFSTWPLEGRFDLIAENTSMQVARQTGGDVIDYYGVNLVTDSVTGAFIDVPSGTHLSFIKTPTAWQMTSTFKQTLIKLSSLPTLSVSQASNAMTVTLSPFSADFRSATLSTGIANSRTLVAALSLVVPSGATLGVPAIVTSTSCTATASATVTMTNAPSAPVQIGDYFFGGNAPAGTVVVSFGTYVGGVAAGQTIVLNNTITIAAAAGTFVKPSRLMVLALDNAGAIEPAIVNQSGNVNLDETGLITTTAISAGATSNNVIYSTTARTNVPYKVVGYIDIANVAAGAYTSNPNALITASGRELAAMWGLGIGQTLKDVKTQRVLGQAYINTNNRPIPLNVIVSNTAGGSIITWTIGVRSYSYTTAVANPNQGVITTFVPPGASYSVSMTGTPTITTWDEA